MAKDFGIARLDNWVSRSISGENVTGAPGQGGRATTGTGQRAASDLGVGWKVSPSVEIAPGEEKLLAEIEGSGAIEHFWISVKPEWWRSLILRIWWDGADNPAVEVPLGDFFCLGWETYAPVTSQYVVVAPYCGMNTFWTMPFCKSTRMTLQNVSDRKAVVYYYLDYGLGEVPDEAPYFHAFWNRSDPVDETHIHTILPQVQDHGSFVGAYLAFGCNSTGWWGEGELKFFIDDDIEFPTICGTGTEDYFGGAWDYEVPDNGYVTYSTPFLGMHQVIKPDGLYQSQTRFGMYRWHHSDPVRFARSLSVTVQDLGWRPDMRYRPRRDDIATVAFWYGRSPNGTHTSNLRPEHLETRSHPDRWIASGVTGG